MATNDKYDRQLRLWGAQGQRALGETRVVCVGTSSAGTETLKNLVLPGVGAFTVMDFVDDDEKTTTGFITDEDASSNFFLPKEKATKAEGACKHLKELNPDVSGSFRNVSLSDVAGRTPVNPSFWSNILEEETVRKDDDPLNDNGDPDPDIAMASEETKTKNLLVIASDIVPSILEALADACWESGHPLVVVTSYGLIGSVRLQLPKKGAVLLQPKPTNSPPDLRLVTSFPAFSDYVDSIVGGDALEKLDSQQHGHVPYPVILAKAMNNYRRAKADTAMEGTSKILPKTFIEKQDFVNNFVKPMARDYDKELNFQEAVSNAYLAYTERELALDMITDKLSPESKLGQLKKALDVFIEEHPDHRPPLNGSVPDMTASTELYVRLQKLYRRQAEEDLQKLTGILRRHQQKAMENFEEVTDEDIVNFCANVFSVGYTNTRSLREEYYGDSSMEEELIDDWRMALMDPYEVPVHTPFLWYLGVRAAQIFCQKEGRYPGCVTHCDSLEADASVLADILRTKVIPHYQMTDQELLSDNIDSICKELTRYGNAEVHTIASVIGGVASQEAVKIVTGQYVPLDNTYVYNGIVSVGGVYKF